MAVLEGICNNTPHHLAEFFGFSIIEPGAGLVKDGMCLSYGGCNRAGLFCQIKYRILVRSVNPISSSVNCEKLTGVRKLSLLQINEVPSDSGLIDLTRKF